MKLVIPLTTMDQNTDRKDVEPLALLGQYSILVLMLLHTDHSQCTPNSHYPI